MLRMNRIFRDRSHPFEAFNDEKLFRKFRFRRQDIIAITDDIERDINIASRSGSLSPLLQVLVTLRYYASGSFLDVCGELIGIDQSTVSRTVIQITEAFLRQVPNHVRLPNRCQADRTKAKFYDTNGFPNVVGCIEGTQIRIQAPSENEQQVGLSTGRVINRKGYHSINVQVRGVCFYIYTCVRLPYMCVGVEPLRPG